MDKTDPEHQPLTDNIHYIDLSPISSTYLSINPNMRIIRSIFNIAVATGLTATAASCSSDSIDAPEAVQGYSPDTQLVINLAIPQGETLAPDPQSRAGQQPTANECAINSLRFIAFDTSTGTVVNRELPIPSTMPVNPDRTAVYEIKSVPAGTYRAYLVGNLDRNVADVTSEEELKQAIMDFSTDLPTAGNLPMVYEPSGNLTIAATGADNPRVVDMSMKFACSKVRINLIFDRNYDPRGEHLLDGFGIRLTGVKAVNVPQKAYVISRHEETFPMRDIPLSGLYYNDYTETPGNINSGDADVITAHGGSGTAPSAGSDKWLWQTTLYLPEHYFSDTADAGRIEIEGYLTDLNGNGNAVKCTYTMPLTESGDDNGKSFPRGMYFEYIGKITDIGTNAELDATVAVRDWTEMTLPADFIHTYLKLSKSEADISSLEDDFITYETDGRGNVGFECTTVLDGKPAVVLADMDRQTPTASCSGSIPP